MNKGVDKKDINTNKKKFRYIYNPYQAHYYQEQGLSVIKTGTHYKTKNTYWIFKNGVALDAVFNKWMSKNRL